MQQMPEHSAASVLGWLARGHAFSRKSFHDDAANWLREHNAPMQSQRLFAKSALGASNTVDSNLGDGVSITQWAESARTRSAFARLLNDGALMRVPMHTRLGMAITTASGYTVGEGAAVPVSRVTFADLILTPVKANAMVVCTDELLRNLSPSGQQAFNRELMGAVSDAIDSQFLAMMIDTGSPSIGSTSPLADVRAALLNVSTVGQAKLYWAASADTAKLGSTLSTNAPAFAACSPTGGEICNLPMVVSSGLADGQLALIDGSGIAADGANITVESSNQATVLQNTAPSMSSAAPTPATGMTSLWQTNSSAILATAWFAAQKLRDDAICVITGITSTTWGA